MNNQENADGCLLFFYTMAAFLLIAASFTIHAIVGIASVLLCTYIIITYFIKAEEKNAESQKLPVPSVVINKYSLSETQFVSNLFFRDLLKQVHDIVSFAEKLDNDQSFHAYTDNLSCVSIKLSEGKFGNLDPDSFIGKILILMLVDFSRSLINAGHKLDLSTKEGFGLLVLISELYGNKISYDTIELYRKHLVGAGEDLIRQLLNLPEPEEKFILSKLIGDFNADYKLQYHILIYRYISLIAKCDTVITQQESDWMDEIMSLGKKEAANPVKEPLFPDDSSDPMEDLSSLIGLDSVKNEINKLRNLIKIQQQRKKNGMKITAPSYHCVFTGNPGTGKTTVARIVSGIYKELGILKKGQLIETDRSGLVAEYVGQTAIKTNKIIDKALDGVLFIDEAYSLIKESKNDYGHEAIATLLKRMEDNRGRLVVILAGYSKEMQDFINSNPGLRSRFNRYIDFSDYSAKELVEIFKLRARKFEYVITPEANEALYKLFSNAVAHKRQGFGNGRFARNIFDKTIELQSTRLAQQGMLTVDKLATILPEDIPA